MGRGWGAVWEESETKNRTTLQISSNSSYHRKSTPYRSVAVNCVDMIPDPVGLSVLTCYGYPTAPHPQLLVGGFGGAKETIVCTSM